MIKEKLKRSLRGEDKCVANSRKIRLLIESGPVLLLFPEGRDFKIDSTSKDEVEIVFRLLSGIGRSEKSESRLSSRIVCQTKKSFSREAFSVSSVSMVSSLKSGGIDVSCSGLIKCLRFFNQSFGPISVLESFAASLSTSDFFDLRISAMILFLMCLYFSK